MLSTLLQFFPLAKFTVVGTSMSPTLTSGKNVLVNKMVYFFRSPRKGEIIALKDPRDKKVLVKRIAKIEKDNIFVLGDNKTSSTDSRTFGMITSREIIGKVIYVE